MLTWPHEEHGQQAIVVVIFDLKATGDRGVERESCRFARSNLTLEVIAVHVKLEGVIGFYAKSHQITFFDGNFVWGHSTSAHGEVESLLPRLISGSTG
jgi:hypothetical protein